LFKDNLTKNPVGIHFREIFIAKEKEQRSDEKKPWFCLIETKKALGKGGHHLAPFYPSTHT